MLPRAVARGGPDRLIAAFDLGGCARTIYELRDTGCGSTCNWRRQAMSGKHAGVRQQCEPSFAGINICEPTALPPPTACALRGNLFAIKLPLSH